MSVIESLKSRARFLVAGFLSFLVILAAMRWSAGEPLLQPAADLGLIIGFVFVAVSSSSTTSTAPAARRAARVCLEDLRFNRECPSAA